MYVLLPKCYKSLLVQSLRDALSDLADVAHTGPHEPLRIEDARGRGGHFHIPN